MPPSPLLTAVRDKLRTLHYSRRTETAYLGWIRRYIRHHRSVHPLSLGVPEVVAFLTWLARERQVAASTQNQARETWFLVAGRWWSGAGGGFNAGL